MGFWDDDDTKDFSAFGIMANTPGPTPDAFLTQEVANKNSTPSYSGIESGYYKWTYQPSTTYTPSSSNNDNRDYTYTPSSSCNRNTPSNPNLQKELKLSELRNEYNSLLRLIASLPDVSKNQGLYDRYKERFEEVVLEMSKLRNS